MIQWIWRKAMTMPNKTGFQLFVVRTVIVQVTCSGRDVEVMQP
jgi:hypothetical protein